MWGLSFKSQYPNFQRKPFYLLIQTSSKHILRQNFFIKAGCHWLSGLGGEKEREFCRPNCLYPLVLGGQLILMCTLHVGAGDLNLGTHACVLSALLANTSPQFLTEITFKSTCVV